jgi:hypothetical protein
MLYDWAEAQSRQKIQCADQKHCPDEQNEKRAAVNWKRPGAHRRDFLPD